MKVVILAGGKGTRISEESQVRPKPMVEIGGRPILWHILKHFSHYGLREFVILAGYKSYVIKDYFANYRLYNSDVTFSLRQGTMEVHQNSSEDWKVTVLDTGEETMTGGRIRMVAPYVGDEDFICTYGDGVGDVDVAGLLAFHRSHGDLATVTATQPPGRFGSLTIEGSRVSSFLEKPIHGGGFVNGGYFVLSPKVLDYIDGPQTVWEREPLERLAGEGRMHAFLHRGFWQPMDTLRDKHLLEELWAAGSAPWKVWDSQPTSSGTEVVPFSREKKVGNF